MAECSKYTLQADDLETIEQVAYAHDLVVQTNYSGRGMHGHVCFGLSGTRQQLWQAVIELAAITVEDLLDSLTVAPSNDRLGHNEIWYWRNIVCDTGSTPEREVK